MTNGLYLNPGSGLFEESLASPLYVDKAMLALIAARGNYAVIPEHPFGNGLFKIFSF